MNVCQHGQLRLTLPAGTAMGIRLRHASREGKDLGRRLSNTRTTCPRVGDTLGNVGNHDGGIPSAGALRTLFSRLKSGRSKGRVRRVPAAAVIPAARVVLIIIEPKTSVAGSVNSWVNRVA